MSRGAFFRNLQVPVVFDKSPNDIRLGFIQHFPVIAEKQVLGNTRLLCLSHQFRVRFRDTDKGG